jgi:hypothetical protein
MKFQILNEYSRLFKDLLDRFDASKFIWCNVESQDQVFDYNSNFFFDAGVYEGEDFVKKIASSSYYVVFVKLQAYQAYTSLNKMKEIMSIEDFLNGDCQIVIKVVDCIFVTVLAKSSGILYAVHNSIKACGYTNIEFITDISQKERDAVW